MHHRLQMNIKRNEHTLSNTIMSSDLPRCRNCLDTSDDVSVFVAPCNCNGSIKWIHPACLTQQQAYERRNTCSVCLAPHSIATYHWWLDADVIVTLLGLFVVLCCIGMLIFVITHCTILHINGVFTISVSVPRWVTEFDICLCRFEVDFIRQCYEVAYHTQCPRDPPVSVQCRLC